MRCCFLRLMTVVVVCLILLSRVTDLVMCRWLSAYAAICGRWVMQMIWCFESCSPSADFRVAPRLASFLSLSPMTVPRRPPMLASISSKTRTEMRWFDAMIDLMASMTRESSPPEATSPMGLGGCPGFAWMSICADSWPWSVKGFDEGLGTSVGMNLASGMPSSESSTSTSGASFLMALFRILVRESAWVWRCPLSSAICFSRAMPD